MIVLVVQKLSNMNVNIVLSNWYNALVLWNSRYLFEMWLDLGSLPIWIAYIGTYTVHSTANYRLCINSASAVEAITACMPVGPYMLCMLIEIHQPSIHMGSMFVTEHLSPRKQNTCRLTRHKRTSSKPLNNPDWGSQLNPSNPYIYIYVYICSCIKQGI